MIVSKSSATARRNEEEKLFNIIKSVYGELETSPRKQGLYIELAKRILTYDVKKKSLVKDQKFKLEDQSFIFYRMFVHLF
jgi:hypothetical protein